MNSYEVLRCIQEFETGSFTDIARDQRRSKEYKDYRNHLTRYFHNYLAGAKTLIDHTRVMMRSSHISEEHREAYQKQIELIFSDDLSKFVGDFRNYTLHRGLPPISHCYTVADEKWEVALELSALKNWKKWTERSRNFLDAHPDKIRLSWLVASYTKNVQAMHEWLMTSFMTYYSQVFTEFDQLRFAFNKQS